MQSPFQQFQTRTPEMQPRVDRGTELDRVPGQQTWSKTRNTASDSECYPVLTHSAGARKRDHLHIGVARKSNLMANQKRDSSIKPADGLG